MKLILFSLLVINIVSIGSSVHAEEVGPYGYVRCLDIELTKEQRRQIKEDLRNVSEQNRSAAQIASVINVYFHIIQDSGNNNPTTDQQINDQMEVLSDAYAGSGLTFVLAGTDTTVNDDWAINLLSGSQEASDMKNALRVGDALSLNIYLTGLGGNLLGYATFPWDYEFFPEDDGVVMLSSTLPGGTAVPYDLGNTAVHEVGHWLGLFHTFQPGLSDINGCVGQGDFVTDTAAEKIPHFNCLPSNSCRKKPGRDPIRNFMNYTPDVCMTTFSRGQFDFINLMLQAYRTS